MCAHRLETLDSLCTGLQALDAYSGVPVLPVQVYLCARSWQNPAWAAETAEPFGTRRNIWRRGIPSHLHPDGGVTFEGGERVDAVDVVMLATGYRYSFPFLADARIGGAEIITVDDNRLALI